MYHMKNIVSFDNEVILPKCMYSLKKIISDPDSDEMDIKISNQVITFLQQAPSKKMSELEERQDILLKKLDKLYDRIKTISSYCKYDIKHNSANVMDSKKDNVVCNIPMEEIVVILSPDNLPWFLNIYLKHAKNFNITWHIHSSVPNDKSTKIKSFFKKFANLYPLVNAKVKLRLIFKSVVTDSELKLTSLALPIVGTVNVLRYLALAYPNIVSYDFENYQVDSLLDLACLLERATDMNKDSLIKKLFIQQKGWIYGNNFSIVDLAVYNVVKQWQNSTKYVPKIWFENCEKIIM